MRTRNTVAGLLVFTASVITAPAFAQDAPAEQPAEAKPADAKPAEAKPEGEAKPADKAADAAGEAAAQATAAKTEAELTPDQRAKYDEHLKAGKKAYANQDFDTAFNQLNAAYGIVAKPSILFNLALISEKGGALERARDHYQKYMAAPGVSLENRKRAAERLAAVQEILATSNSADEARAKSQVTDLLPALEAMGIESMPEENTEVAKTGGETNGQTDKTAQTDKTEPDNTLEAPAKTTPDVKYTWPVYAAFGTATAALAGGVVMVAMTNKRIEEGKTAGREGDDAGLAQAEEDASLYATSAAGLFAGGAVLAIVGSYFVVRNSKTAEADAAAADAEKNAPQASMSFSLDKNFLGPVFNLKF